MIAPALSVVVPTLNESASLDGLWRCLEVQRDISFQVVVADGGSGDGTIRLARERCRETAFPVSVVSSPPGRGRQMNAGALASSAPDLLFLHADSELKDPHALARALADLESERTRRGTDRVAGHFGVRFLRSVSRERFGYYYLEAKTHLSRPGCINGDQGFLLSRGFFEELGGFDESLSILEDSRLAERVFTAGSWVTLPGRLGTAARRFEAEGLAERQALNALIRAFEAIGCTAFLSGAAGLYRRHDQMARLELLPFFRLAHRHMVDGGLRGMWWQAGGYASTQAWQVAFALDCLRNFRKRIPAGEGATPVLASFDRRFGRLAENRAGHLAATLLACSWFYATLAWLGARSTLPQALNRRVNRR